MLPSHWITKNFKQFGIICLILFAYNLYAQEELNHIKLPPGFKISYYAKSVPGARSLALAPDGTVFVGTRGIGKVYALQDKDNNGEAEQVIVVADNLNVPNGVTVLGNDLFVAESTRILKFPNILQNLEKTNLPIVFFSQFPQQWSHGWKYLAAGPDGNLYVSIGAPCNVCESEHPTQATIINLSPQAELQIYAHGVRNSVGFDWHPSTKDLWFTDNGRDWLGDNAPPDELNQAQKPGMHFGFPYCHGGTIKDPKLGSPGACKKYTPPVANLGAHVASLGMRFYTGSMFPKNYKNQIFIAEHGSWNRSKKTGYRVSLVTIDNKGNANYEPFATGWLADEDNVLGRPVDVLVMPDGALLVSDDFKGAVYRITFANN